jgi:hypothetical protein
MNKINKLKGDAHATAVTLPDKKLPPGYAYVFEASVRSWLGGVATSAQVTVHKAALEVPSVTIENANRLVSRADKVATRHLSIKHSHQNQHCTARHSTTQHSTAPRAPSSTNPILILC